MRTTLTLENDVLDKARALAAKRGTSFRSVVNEALRAGLEDLQSAGKCRPYRMKGRKMGLRPGIDLDNVQELLSQIEGEDAR